MIFLGMLVAKIISGETFTLRVLLGPAVGGIVGGLFVYILGIILAKKKPKP
jgi:hypothetical protein